VSCCVGGGGQTSATIGVAIRIAADGLEAGVRRPRIQAG